MQIRPKLTIDLQQLVAKAKAQQKQIKAAMAPLAAKISKTMAQFQRQSK